MIRRIVDFVFILIFVWGCMLLGLWVIDTLIVPMNLSSGLLGDMLSNVAKAIISVSMVLLWLLVWREIVKRIFWKVLKKR